MTQYFTCAHCLKQVLLGHSCPLDPDRLRDDLAQNAVARAGHEAGREAAETVAGILHGGAAAAPRAGDDER